MRFKLTLKSVLNIIWIVLLVTILNIIGIIGILIINNNKSLDSDESNLTREFKKYVYDDNYKIYINEDGKRILKKNGVWIQILNENSEEVYKYNTNRIKLQKKYKPIDLINGYKYTLGDSSTVSSEILVSSKKIGKIEYTYLLGFDRSKLSKYVFTYKTKTLLKIGTRVIWCTLLIDVLIALLFGFLSSRKLTKPIDEIIMGVENLEEGKYHIYYKEEGIYENVYKKLNKLANTLSTNEEERKEIDKFRREWIANLTHDIKTPLSSIKGYAEILSDKDYYIDIEEAREYATIIDQKSNYIKELVDDLNLTMKLRNANNFLSKREENIVLLVKSTIIQILNDPNYSNRLIDFTTNRDFIKWHVDVILFRRAINNLIYNSLIHNDENTQISVDIKYKDEEETIITIKDNGKGITKKDLEKIFDRYFRGTNTGEDSKGSGLGMAITKEILNAHGYEINIESELAVGTKVEVVLKNNI